MKAGNVSQTVLKRSVLKQLHTEREEVLFAPSVEEMCSGVRVPEGAAVLSAQAVVSGNAKTLGRYALLKAVIDLASRGAAVSGASVQMILPLHAYESRIKEMVRQVEDLAAELHIQIACAKAEVSPAARQSIVTVSALGTVKEESLIRPGNMKSGQEIILCGYVGLEGMLRILDEREEELRERFVPAFLEQMKGQRRKLNTLEAVYKAASCGVSAIQQIGSGGIFAALWEMLEAASLGMDIRLSDITVSQETIEVCEYYHLNPYQMTSAGSVLIVTDQGETLLRALDEVGARASRLGVTTAERARVITSGEEQRYLDRPAPDELMRWWEMELAE